MVRCSICGKKVRKDTYAIKHNTTGLWACENKACYHEVRSLISKNNPTFYKTGTEHPGYIHGRSQEPYPAKWNRSFKQAIVDRDGGICSMCGKSEAECSRKLAVHHINYDKNDLDGFNLITLCPSCHSKTNRNRDYWFDELMDMQAFKFIGEAV